MHKLINNSIRRFITQVSSIALAFTIEGMTLYAQTNIEDNLIIRNSLDQMFQNLDKTKVPTGLLLDYAVDLVDLSLYTGEVLNNTNCVDSHIFEDILRSLQSACVNNSFKNISNTMSNFNTPYISNTVNIGLALYKYNFIKANALDDNLIIYNEDTDKVSDRYISGIWQNPYDEAQLFVFSPSSNLCNIGDVTYNFSPTFLFNNQGFTNLYFDAGDGNGYREINPMSSVTVKYSTSGEKNIKLKVTTSSGSVLESHSFVYLIEKDIDIPTKGNSLLAPTDSIICSKTYNGVNVSAQVTFYSSTNSNLIRKPFIVVEGFDPWTLKYITDGGSSSKLGYTSHKTSYNNFCNCSDLYKTYDFIYVDWHNSTEDIRANAELLKHILSIINQKKAEAESIEKNIVLGQSMGGLVSRYALKSMENEGVRHQVSTFISHDTPHLGANVPLGVLYFINQFISLSHGYSTVINITNLLTNNLLSNTETILYDIIHSTAAKQMLFNYVTPAGIRDNTIHNEWQAELESLGFPNGDNGEYIENLSIVNGRESEQNFIVNQYLFYLNGYAKTRFLSELLSPVISSLTGYIVQHILN